VGSAGEVDVTVRPRKGGLVLAACAEHIEARLERW
jgi:hypothetical protein